MKKNKIIRIIISIFLLSAFFVNLASCAVRVKADNLMDGVTPRQITAMGDLSDGNQYATDFAIRLFKATNENGKNVLISPLSVLTALAMTANGAMNETRNQMEGVFGMSVEELNLYLYTYVNSLPQAEKYKLALANSIWFTEAKRFSVNHDFLQLNADYYGADIYKAPFNKRTVKDINNWVKSKTDKMIPKVIDEISPGAVMYLINALAFEAEWSRVYEKYQVSDAKFTGEDGSKQDVELMYSKEGKYLEDEKATGFIKYYKNAKYAFVALLPNENVSVTDYVNSLDGASLNELLKNAESRIVETAIPKFETEYSTEMSEILAAMGMTDAFNDVNADFSALGTSEAGNIFISSVLHKTYIQVGEKGTKAGAVTVIEMNDASAAPPDEIKRVYLDRPFVYMLIDCENNVPFFIGTLMEVN
ncbi:MAG: serine protease [Ruminococcaceae bacterium]|nr:serine protease [Oscillospiraceae bacterium]